MNLLQLIQNLSPEQKSKLIQLLQSESNTTNENLTESRFSNGLFCPKCGCTENITKFGFKNGHQRFRCKNCGRIFNEVTNSFLMGTKKNISIWKKYLECMLNHLPIRKSAITCGINKTTAFVWRHKILDALSIKVEREVKLSGVIEVDETFFNISYKGMRNLPREPHKRGFHSPKRGISNDQVCVTCAVDRNKNSYGKISNLGRVRIEDLVKLFEGRVEGESIICSDSNKAYRKFVEGMGCKHVGVESGKYRNGIYHINHINAYHSRLKTFLRKFNGVATKYLNNYVVWCSGVMTDIVGLVKVVCEMRYRTFGYRKMIPII